jgi:glycerol-3-phosphate dehydrogenase
VTYFDAATHDTRLTLAVAVSAEREGALLVSRCRAEGLIEADGDITGAAILDQLGQRSLEVPAGAVALCAART